MEDYTILIVDDEEKVRNALVRVLRSEGYRIFTASNSQEALTKLDEGKVDLVLADNQMPGVSGIELFFILKKRWPDTIRLLITGRADTEIAINAINKGEVYRFITKPWDPEELKVTIRQALEHHKLMRENQNLLQTVKRQANLLSDLERKHPGITELPRDEEGFYVIEEP